MDTGSWAESADNLHQDSDEPDRATNVKPKPKRRFLGNLKDKIFGHKKKRTKSQDSVQSKGTSDSVGDGVKVTGSTESCDQRLGNAIFPPAEDLNFPKPGIMGMKNTSASLEALTSGSKLKSELERKLVNRRSLEDDGLPGSPIGTPTGDNISNSNLMKNNVRKGYDSHRFDRDSDGSLLSIGSSENEEDAFFKNPWKAAHTSAVRRPRHGTLSSDSEPEDTLDFDAVGKTSNLSNAAAMHKRNVRPRNRNKARRVTSTRQMPSLAEKKTLEIAHTFLDDGDSSALKLRGVDTATASAIRRADSGRSCTSPAAQRKSEPVSVNEVTASKSPRPSSALPSNVSHRKQHSEELNSHDAELLSRFQKMRPQAGSESAEVESQSVDSAPVAEENTPASQPPRPPKTVGFTSTPPLQRRSKPPAVQPRPKSMFPQQVRSRTHEVQGSKVEEALSTLSHSKSFNVSEHSKPSPEIVLRSKANQDSADDSGEQALPEWARLAKRKTWAITEPNVEGPKADVDKPAADKRPVPVPKAKPDNTKALGQVKKEQTTPVTNELQTKLSQIHAKNESDSVGCPVDGEVNAPPTSRASAGSTSSYDNLVIIETPDKRLSDDGAKAKPRTTKTTQANGIETLATPVEPAWKASIKARTGSLKPSTTGSPDAGSFLSTPNVQQKPAWKSATMKERATPSSFLSASTEGLDDLGTVRAKSSTLEARTPPSRMTMSETSALDSPSDPPGEEPKSFKDRLKMFQSQ